MIKEKNINYEMLEIVKSNYTLNAYNAFIELLKYKNIFKDMDKNLYSYYIYNFENIKINKDLNVYILLEFTGYYVIISHNNNLNLGSFKNECLNLIQYKDLVLLSKNKKYVNIVELNNFEISFEYLKGFLTNKIIYEKENKRVDLSDNLSHKEIEKEIDSIFNKENKKSQNLLVNKQFKSFDKTTLIKDKSIDIFFDGIEFYLKYLQLLFLNNSHFKNAIFLKFKGLIKGNFLFFRDFLKNIIYLYLSIPVMGINTIDLLINIGKFTLDNVLLNLNEKEKVLLENIVKYYKISDFMELGHVIEITLENNFLNYFFDFNRRLKDSKAKGLEGSQILNIKFRTVEEIFKKWFEVIPTLKKDDVEFYYDNLRKINKLYLKDFLPLLVEPKDFAKNEKFNKDKEIMYNRKIINQSLHYNNCSNSVLENLNKLNKVAFCINRVVYNFYIDVDYKEFYLKNILFKDEEFFLIEIKKKICNLKLEGNQESEIKFLIQEKKRYKDIIKQKFEKFNFIIEKIEIIYDKFNRHFYIKYYDFRGRLVVFTKWFTYTGDKYLRGIINFWKSDLVKEKDHYIIILNLMKVYKGTKKISELGLINLYKEKYKKIFSDQIKNCFSDNIDEKKEFFNFFKNSDEPELFLAAFIDYIYIIHFENYKSNLIHWLDLPSSAWQINSIIQSLNNLWQYLNLKPQLVTDEYGDFYTFIHNLFFSLTDEELEEILRKLSLKNSTEELKIYKDKEFMLDFKYYKSCDLNFRAIEKIILMCLVYSITFYGIKKYFLQNLKNVASVFEILEKKIKNIDHFIFILSLVFFTFLKKKGYINNLAGIKLLLRISGNLYNAYVGYFDTKYKNLDYILDKLIILMNFKEYDRKNIILLIDMSELKDKIKNYVDNTIIDIVNLEKIKVIIECIDFLFIQKLKKYKGLLKEKQKKFLLLQELSNFIIDNFSNKKQEKNIILQNLDLIIAFNEKGLFFKQKNKSLKFLFEYSLFYYGMHRKITVKNSSVMMRFEDVSINSKLLELDEIFCIKKRFQSKRTYQYKTDLIDILKSVSSSSANVTHGYDALLVMLMTDIWVRVKKKELVTISDAYGVLAGDVKEFYDVFKEIFINVFENNYQYIQYLEDGLVYYKDLFIQLNYIFDETNCKEFKIIEKNINKLVLEIKNLKLNFVKINKDDLIKSRYILY